MRKSFLCLFCVSAYCCILTLMNLSHHSTSTCLLYCLDGLLAMQELLWDCETVRGDQTRFCLCVRVISKACLSHVTLDSLIAPAPWLGHCVQKVGCLADCRSLQTPFNLVWLRVFTQRGAITSLLCVLSDIAIGANRSLQCVHCGSRQ